MPSIAESLKLRDTKSKRYLRILHQSLIHVSIRKTSPIGFLCSARLTSTFPSRS
jgi:hypothetical protein